MIAPIRSEFVHRALIWFDDKKTGSAMPLSTPINSKTTASSTSV
jgi:hypothetical protein